MLTKEQISSNYKIIEGLNLGVKIHPVVSCKLDLDLDKPVMDFIEYEKTCLVVLYRTKRTEWIFLLMEQMNKHNYVFFYKGNIVSTEEYNKRTEMGLKNLIKLNGGDDPCVICLEETAGLYCCTTCSASYCQECIQKLVLKDLKSVKNIIAKCKAKGIHPDTTGEVYVDHSIICCQCKQSFEFKLEGHHAMTAIINMVISTPL